MIFNFPHDSFDSGLCLHICHYHDLPARAEPDMMEADHIYDLSYLHFLFETGWKNSKATFVIKQWGGA